MTTETTLTVVPQPTAEEIKAATLKKLEADLRDYYFLQSIEEDASEEAAKLKPGIMAAINKYGIVPDSAPKSHRMETGAHIGTVTVGSSVEIDDNAVAELKTLLGKKKRLRLMFDQLFAPRIKYALQPTARDLILFGKWPKEIVDQVKDAYLRCISAKTTSPALTVDSKEEIAERQRQAEAEAAAKAQAAAAKKAAKRTAA